MKEKIKDIFINLGADVCGMANIDRFTDAPKGFHPTDIYDECKNELKSLSELCKKVKIYSLYFNLSINKKIEACF